MYPFIYLHFEILVCLFCVLLDIILDFRIVLGDAVPLRRFRCPHVKSPMRLVAFVQWAANSGNGNRNPTAFRRWPAPGQSNLQMMVAVGPRTLLGKCLLRLSSHAQKSGTPCCITRRQKQRAVTTAGTLAGTIPPKLIFLRKFSET